MTLEFLVTFRASKTLPIIILLAILVLGGLNDVLLLTKSLQPLGIDGYYYILQVKYLLSTGHLYFKTNTPFVLYFLSVSTWLLGDPIIAVKVASIFLHTMLSLGVFAIVKCITQSSWFSIMASGICAFAGSHFFMIVEFINYLGAITIFIWGSFFFINIVKTQKLKWLLISGLLLILSLFSHRSIYVIFPVISCLIFFSWLIIELKDTFNSKILIPCIVLLFWTIGLIGKSIFLNDSSTSSFNELNQLWQQTFARAPEIVLLVIASTVILVLNFMNSETKLSKNAQIVVVSIVLWSLLFTINPFFIFDNNSQSVIGRINGLAYIQAAILVPTAIFILSEHRRLRLYIGAVIIPVVCMSPLSPLPRGAHSQYLTDREWLFKNLSTNYQKFKDISIIVAPHGEEFLVTYTLAIPSQQRQPVNNIYGKVYWLIHDVERKPIHGEFFRLNNNSGADTVIMEERVLSEYLRSVSSFQMSLLQNSNEHLRRLSENSQLHFKETN